MESTIQFIEVVKRHEAIYDITHKDYKNMERKAQAWQSVASEVGLTVEAAKRKWKNLRDSYTKYLRSFRTGTKTSRKYQYWAHAGHMDFLRPFQGPGRSQPMKLECFDSFSGQLYKQEAMCDLGFEVLEKCSPDDIDVNDFKVEHRMEENIFSANSISKNRPLLRVKDLDSTALFFLSLARSVRLMPRKQQASIKMRCMKIVSEAEIELDSSVMEIKSNMSSSQLGENSNGSTVMEIATDTMDTPQQIEQQNEQNEQNETQEMKEHEDGQPQQQQSDNSEHFLYVMSPSKVEAMIDISSDEENPN